jgi:hypothetical protein
VASHEAIGGRDVLTIGRLALDLRLLSLLGRQIDVEEFIVHDVDFLALREDGGARNIGPFLERYRSKKNRQPKATTAQAEELAPRPAEVRTTAPAQERAPGTPWAVRVRHAEIRNVAATVRSEGEPSRQNGEASAMLEGLIITELEWPSKSGKSGTVKLNDFTLDGIGGRWDGTRILSLESATVTTMMLPNTLVFEDAYFQAPLYRQSWDHLMRDQITRTEDLLELVFSAQDKDFVKPEESENEEAEAPPAVIAAVPEAAESSSGASSGEIVATVPVRDRKPARRESAFKTDIRRLRIADANWIRQTRIDGAWNDVITNFDLEIHRDGTVTTTTVTGRSNYEDSQFEIRYGVDEDEDRTIAIRARRMPFHQMFWGETIKDERIPRVEHVLYDLNVDVTHHLGVLLGEAQASFSEVRVTPDRRPFWQRISLQGGGWATILSELADPETAASAPIPFHVERPLLEFNFFVLYTELQAAFDEARLALVDPENNRGE